jgi:hypothetical protein
LWLELQAIGAVEETPLDSEVQIGTPMREKKMPMFNRCLQAGGRSSSPAAVPQF